MLTHENGQEWPLILVVPVCKVELDLLYCCLKMGDAESPEHVRCVVESVAMMRIR